MSAKNIKDMQEEKPPFLGKWRNVYLIVIVVLILIIFLLDLLTRYFS